MSKQYNVQGPSIVNEDSEKEDENIVHDGSHLISHQKRTKIDDSVALATNYEDKDDNYGRSRLRSWVWQHFKRQKKDEKGIITAICNYCHISFKAIPKHGTSGLRDHFNICPKRKMNKDPLQMLLNTQQMTNAKPNSSNYIFDQEAGRRELAGMIILHELPLSIVEYNGFRRFVSTIQPLFHHVSRSTIKRDIFKIYDIDRAGTIKFLEKFRGKIAITTDMWTSNTQKKGFMAITAHFIDDSWNMQTQILRFAYVPCPHTAEALSEVLLESFLDWNVDRKLSTITVDNCTTNDAIIRLLLERLDRSSLLLHGSLFHMRCCAHILNLIVRDGLEVIQVAIDKIRESVLFWTAFEKREQTFEIAARQLNIPSTKKLCLDCKTRWNSTYLMLNTAIVYKIVFQRLRQREPLYKVYPNDLEWDLAKEISEKLKIFYMVTELFSGTKYPTANLYFPYVCRIKVALMKWVNDPNGVIRQMASNMMEKFSKYWDVTHGILGVACVLDPRYKIKLLDFYFRSIYGAVEAQSEVSRIQTYCYDLLQEYKSNFAHGKHETVLENPSFATSLSSIDLMEDDVDILKDYDLYVSMSSDNGEVKSEFDHYLEEGVLPRTPDFDVLSWWRTNGVKFSTLQLIAKDILAIPISTVASESSFSTGGRLINPHRSRLHPKTVEALMCSQNWLWNKINGDSNSLRLHSPPTVTDEENDVEIDERLV